MSGHAGTALRLEDLPKTIPVFPLTGVLLLPHGRLPLNVFEPRYLAMVEDALAARDRIIGMIQPRQPGSEGMTRGGVTPPSTPLYATGCAGRIAHFSETGDGRYMITLRGICRFDTAEELPTVRGYRRVVADYTRWRGDLAEADQARGVIDRERLIAPLRAYFAAHNVATDWDLIAETPDDRLVSTLAMNCPFAPQEKQALLECATLTDLAKTVTALIEMAASGQSDDTARH
jgi:Lon protease-like protein